MKKMIAIIIVLLIIFISMAIYKYVIVVNNQIKIEDVNKIEEYISKIYCWKEVTDEALPKFNSINEAPEKWVWEVVKKNSEEYELSYDQIKNKQTELFGEKLTKEYPKEGTEIFKYNKEDNKYIASETQTDENDDNFFVNKITKIKNGYEVEILEYLEDYSKYEQNEVLVKNLKEEIIATLDTNEVERKTIEVLKNNMEKFTTRKITLKYKNEQIYVEKVEG
jgi:hypothetical protein